MKLMSKHLQWRQLSSLPTAYFLDKIAIDVRWNSVILIKKKLDSSMVKDPYTRIGLLGSQAIFDNMRLVFGFEHRWPSLSVCRDARSSDSFSRRRSAVQTKGCVCRSHQPQAIISLTDVYNRVIKYQKQEHPRSL